ncbi:MAG: sugar kinase [Chloroflexi bacterium]|nr:sugar kinase [Chloroflexota bacterium]
MPRFDVTTVGEGQLRYSVPLGSHLERASQLDVNVTGTEANVTSLLSRLGWRCGWVSALPKNPLGRRVAQEYALSGLDLSAVHWSEDGRLAIYYVEFGTPPKGTQVYYDRKGTCFVNMTRDDIDWDYLLDTRLLHISGLSVPLSPSINAILREAVERAKAAGIPISFDMNYRSRIWTTDEAAEAIAPYLQAIDILFFARGDAERMYGFTGRPAEIVQQLGELTSASAIVTSLGSEGIVAWDRDSIHIEPAKDIEVIDRIGAGDAMVAGVLHGWLQGDTFKGLRYGVLTAALCLTHYGDAVYITRGELEDLLDSPDLDIVR